MPAESNHPGVKPDTIKDNLDQADNILKKRNKNGKTEYRIKWFKNPINQTNKHSKTESQRKYQTIIKNYFDHRINDQPPKK